MRRAIDRHRHTCETCGRENVCHTAVDIPYSRHLRSERHRACEDLQAVADRLLIDRFGATPYVRVRQTMHLFARVGDVGYFAVTKDGILGTLDREAFRTIVLEAMQHRIVTPYHVYGRTCIYPGPSIQFYGANL